MLGSFRDKVQSVCSDYTLICCSCCLSMFSSRWSGVIPAFYPQFSDGWTYCGVNMDDMGLSLPPANTQQVLTLIVGLASTSSLNSRTVRVYSCFYSCVTNGTDHDRR